jgi:hypothetical protein
MRPWPGQQKDIRVRTCDIQGISDETYLFYFDITFFWKSILNFRLLENNELICPFYACFFVFENLDFGQKVFARVEIRTRPIMSKKREPQRFRTCRKNKKCSIFHDLSEYIIFHMVVNYWTGPLIIILQI